MESAENQTELFEALLKWMASFRVAAGKMIREGLTKGICPGFCHSGGAGSCLPLSFFLPQEQVFFLFQKTVLLF